MAGVMGPSVLLTLHVALAAGPTASAAGRSGSVDAPFSADAFVDSVGVNTHITYTDTIYAKNFSLVNDTLKDLGVRHIRDGCYSGWHGVNELDVSVMCLPEVTTKGRKLDFSQLEPQLHIAHDNITRLLAVEGPNEYDLSGDQFWALMLQSYQRLLGNLSSVLLAPRKVPVIAPSMGHGPQNARSICTGADVKYCDRANMHSYPGGGPPINGLMENMQRNAWVVTDPTRKIWATETGYHTATRQYPVREQLGVDEATQGKYTPRLLLLYFAWGVERTFLYELLDQSPDTNRSNPESDYGLVRNDFTWKPAATAIKSLLGLLGEPGQEAFKPAPLAATFAAPLPALFNYTVLGKSSGIYFVAVWLEAESYDVQTQTPIAVAPQKVTFMCPPGFKL